MKTARFWHYSHGGAVLIKIRQGQTLHHWVGHSTDEGWTSSTSVWTFDGETLVSEWCDDGVDCDGRLTRSGSSVCTAANLKAGYVDEDGLAFPLWERGDEYQRDYSAEAMNY